MGFWWDTTFISTRFRSRFLVVSITAPPIQSPRGRIHQELQVEKAEKFRR
jgi:hypothetical protein